MQTLLKITLIWLVLGLGIFGPLISVSQTSPHYGVASHMYRLSLFQSPPPPSKLAPGLISPQPALESLRYGLNFSVQSGLQLLLFAGLAWFSIQLSLLTTCLSPAPLQARSIDLPPPDKPPSLRMPTL